ncbi:thiamine-phosphate synthase family protein [Halarchaeum nitratireducens]|uniref:Phosphomethylpyrimidine kinase n=1 Tax=Halarchaeum nitratireducens TaxID=489913 RepID=A0A830G8Z5_9EURY|nr:MULTISPECIES: thiamine-phosphate synthase family protein [Halarchaeum]MBP2249874.1 putative fused transcriptional regulator/phosphomethylpyrimidine kinase/putative transcriptional regulator [Halarchaeum solikamskense]GGN10046.1 phosphomethylpyrimidine kinase [Halarchaeum nitratireducens]
METTRDDGLVLPAEVIADEFIPTMRVALARALSERGRSQREIAGFLGVTQAAVSNYLAGEARTTDRLANDERFTETVERVADGWTAGDYTGYDALVEFRRLLDSFVDRGPICALHEDAMPALDGRGCDLCVRGRDGAAARERETLRDVRTAVRRFAAADATSAHVPNVGTNVASALPDADEPADVAAVPGRLHAIRGRVEVPSEPAFGASQHVASALLVAAERDDTVGGALNVATSDALLDASRSRGYDPVEFDAGYDDRAAELREAFADGVPTVAYHDGAYGMEPICYVFGADARDAVERALTLVDAVGE